MHEEEDQVEEQSDVARKIGQWGAWLSCLDALDEL